MATYQEDVERMMEGDEKAFEQLFDIYHNKLYRMAYLISGNHADSEDIVQETFLKCYLNRKKLKNSVCFESWLYQILTRTAWRIGKSSKKEEPVEELWSQEEENSYQAGPLEVLLVSQQREQIYKAVRELPLKQRTTVILYYYNQFTTKEIARVMGCFEGTVKSRLHTARKNLEEKLQTEVEEETLWKKRSLMQ